MTTSPAIIDIPPAVAPAVKPGRRPRSALPADLDPSAVVVAVDAREQLPWDLSPLRTVIESGQSGDYRLRDAPDAIVLERKSLADFVCCCGNERERFEAELERLRAFPVKAVIIEASWSDLAAGEWRSKIKPQCVVASALGWIAQGIPVIPMDSRQRAQEYAAKLLYLAAQTSGDKPGILPPASSTTGKGEPMPSAAEIRAMAKSPAEFRARLLIDADGESRPFSEIIDREQAADFAAMDDGWRAAAGHGGKPQYRRCYLERGRGSSKTTDLAVSLTWALLFAKRAIVAVAAAGDADQAKLLRDAIAKLARMNPWIGDALDCQQWRIRNTRTDAALDILSADVGSSFGLLPDVLAIDEIVHWPNEGLWESLISAAAKRKNCIVQVISNAGLGRGSSWQWRVREACRTDPAWFFSRRESVASWIDPAHLAEQARLLSTSAYRRLWENEWSTGAGDALDADDLAAAVDAAAGPILERQRGYGYLGGLDLGISNDHSAFVALGKHGTTGRLRLASCQSWAPGLRRKVDLEAVQEAVLQAHKRFRFSAVFYDVWQCELMAVQLRRAGVPMEPVKFVGATLNELAVTLLETFRSRAIDLFHDDLLLRDLRRLTIMEKSFGYKLESTRDKDGHADRATALALALLAAKNCNIVGSGSWGGPLQSTGLMSRLHPGGGMYAEPKRNSPFSVSPSSQFS